MENSKGNLSLSRSTNINNADGTNREKSKLSKVQSMDIDQKNSVTENGNIDFLDDDDRQTVDFSGTENSEDHSGKKVRRIDKILPVDTLGTLVI